MVQKEIHRNIKRIIVVYSVNILFSSICITCFFFEMLASNTKLSYVIYLLYIRSKMIYFVCFISVINTYIDYLKHIDTTILILVQTTSTAWWKCWYLNACVICVYQTSTIHNLISHLSKSHLKSLKFILGLMFHNDL